MDKVLENLDEFVDFFYEDFFEKNITIKEIFRNTELKVQKEELKKSLQYIFSIINDKPLLDEYLHQLGARHYAYAINSTQYNEVKESLFKTFKHIYKDSWSPDIEFHVENFLRYLCSAMKEGALEIERSHHG